MASSASNTSVTIRLYFDEDSMRHALVNALRSRGMDVTTASDQSMINREDDDHLDYATQQGRVLFSFNRGDFFQLHSESLAQGKAHAGIILANQQQYSTGDLMRRILRLAAARAESLQEHVSDLLFEAGLQVLRYMVSHGACVGVQPAPARPVGTNVPAPWGHPSRTSESRWPCPLPRVRKVPGTLRPTDRGCSRLHGILAP